MKHAGRLIEALNDCRTVYFCGLAKNVGKTVALRQALLEARLAGRRVAVTSVGRDGEAFDAIYREFPKPRLKFEQGDIVIGAEELFPTKKTFTTLHRFEIVSPLGRIVAARVDAVCELEVAGPPTVSALRMVQAWLARQEVDLFLVDGAIDRKAVSLPDVCDGIVLSTGAALGGRMQEVVEETCSALEMLGMEQDVPQDGELRIRYSPLFDSESELLKFLAQTAAEDVVIEVLGGVTDRLVQQLIINGAIRRVRLVADCFAKIFVRRHQWSEYRRLGLRIAYRRRVRVLSLTLNPVAPGSPGFISGDFLSLMRGAVPWLPVFDVNAHDYGTSVLSIS